MKDYGYSKLLDVASKLGDFRLNKLGLCKLGKQRYTLKVTGFHGEGFSGAGRSLQLKRRLLNQAANGSWILLKNTEWRESGGFGRTAYFV